MAATDLHVNGPAFIDVALDGNLNFSRLGVTVDGPDVDLDGNYEDVFGDDAGPFVPTDVQYFGEVATIRTELIRWDEPFLRRVLGRIVPNPAGVLTFPDADVGTLVLEPSRIGNNNNHYALRYASSARTGLNREQARLFPACYPMGSVAYKPGTRVHRYTITWRAIPFEGNLYRFV